MARPVLIRDQETAVIVGLGLTLLGAYVLWDAFEGRGRSRPFAMRAVGVVT